MTFFWQAYNVERILIGVGNTEKKEISGALSNEVSVVTVPFCFVFYEIDAELDKNFEADADAEIEIDRPHKQSTFVHHRSCLTSAPLSCYFDTAQ
jgi:hypothetical protein